MDGLRIRLILLLFIYTITFGINAAYGWHDETHLAVAKAAGYSKWYNAVGADIAKIKAEFIERNNHHFNNTGNLKVTPEMVFAQVGRYNSPSDMEGHLYGAVIASLREYMKTREAGKYPEYHMAFCAHYIGDLSMPLHNTPYDDFNRARHSANDGAVEDEALRNTGLIGKNMYQINLRQNHFEEDLAKEISRIANISRMLGHKLREEKRDITREEAYIQLGHSASLLRAILKYLGKIN